LRKKNYPFLLAGSGHHLNLLVIHFKEEHPGKFSKAEDVDFVISSVAIVGYGEPAKLIRSYIGGKPVGEDMAIGNGGVMTFGGNILTFLPGYRFGAGTLNFVTGNYNVNITGEIYFNDVVKEYHPWKSGYFDNKHPGFEHGQYQVLKNKCIEIGNALVEYISASHKSQEHDEHKELPTSTVPPVSSKTKAGAHDKEDSKSKPAVMTSDHKEDTQKSKDSEQPKSKKQNIAEKEITPTSEKEKPCYIEVKFSTTDHELNASFIEEEGQSPRVYHYEVIPSQSFSEETHLKFSFALKGKKCQCKEENVSWYEGIVVPPEAGRERARVSNAKTTHELIISKSLLPKKGSDLAVTFVVECDCASGQHSIIKIHVRPQPTKSSTY